MVQLYMAYGNEKAPENVNIMHSFSVNVRVLGREIKNKKGRPDVDRAEQSDGGTKAETKKTQDKLSTNARYALISILAYKSVHQQRRQNSYLQMMGRESFSTGKTVTGSGVNSGGSTYTSYNGGSSYSYSNPGSSAAPSTSY